VEIISPNYYYVKTQFIVIPHSYSRPEGVLRQRASLPFGSGTG